jgi:hypothetical protein
MEVGQGPNLGCSAKEKKIVEMEKHCSIAYIQYEVPTVVAMESSIF